MKYCLLIIALLAGCSQLPVSVPSDSETHMLIVADKPVVIAPAPVMAAPPPPVFPSSVEPITPIAAVVMPPVSRKVTAAKPPEHLLMPITGVADEIAAQLTDAALTVNIPASANVSDTVSVVVSIDPMKTVGQSTGSGTVAMIKVSKIVEAKLIAPGFTIVALSPDKQALSPTEPTEWKWQLSGATPGKHSVHISINAIVSVDNDRAERTVKTFENTVEIEITPQQWIVGVIKQHLEWIWTTLLLPAGLWLWKRFKKGDEK